MENGRVKNVTFVSLASLAKNLAAFVLLTEDY